MSDRYAAQYGISGTAFTPNPDLDPDWGRELADLEKEFRQALDESVRGAVKEK